MFSAESPLQFYVNQASSPSVTAYGPGLSYGVANKQATFTVFTDDASEGEQSTATRFKYFASMLHACLSEMHESRKLMRFMSINVS